MALNLRTPQSKLDCNRELFTIIAPEYDRITRLLSFFADQRWKRLLVQNLNSSTSPTVVDFACGTGDLSAMLAARYPDGRVLGADLTLPMLRLAQDRRKGAGRIDYAQVDMGIPPVKSETVDIVSGGYALRNAPDLPQFLREVHRILRPGGVAGFLDFSRSGNAFMSRLQCAVLRLWGSLFGLILHRRPEVYGYIAASLRLFPDRKSLETLLRDCGFEEIRTKTFYFGTTAMVTCRKK